MVSEREYTECDMITLEDRVQWASAMRADIAVSGVARIDVARKMGCTPAYLTKILNYPERHRYSVLTALKIQDAIRAAKSEAAQ